MQRALTQPLYYSLALFNRTPDPIINAYRRFVAKPCDPTVFIETEVISPSGPWRSFIAVEFAILEGVDGFDHHWLLGLIGNIPPVELEAKSDVGEAAPQSITASNTSGL